MRTRRDRERGMSTLELLGCVLAVGVGVWAGAMYMGIDLKSAWNVVMVKVGVTEELPENIDGEQAVEKTPTDANADDTAADRNSNASAGSHNAAQATDSETPSTQQSPGGQSTSAAAHLTKKQKMGQATLAYWNRLNAIMLKEEQMRQVPAGGLTQGNSSVFLLARGKASRFAALEIGKLSTANVDVAVVALAEEIEAWYEEAAEQSDEALELMGQGSIASGKGPEAQRWSSGERQLYKELELINSKGDALRGKMIVDYRLPFPDLR